MGMDFKLPTNLLKFGLTLHVHLLVLLCSFTKLRKTILRQ